jgi:bromodomain-containing protein 7/9
MSSKKKVKKKKLPVVLRSCLAKLRRRDKRQIFYLPVDVEQVPSYLEVIEQPMDFSTLEKNVENGKYKNVQEFKLDVDLIWDNCMTFNQDDSIYFQVAEELKQWANENWEKFEEMVEVEPAEAEVKNTSRKRSHDQVSTPQGTMASAASAAVGQTQQSAYLAARQQPAQQKRKYVKSGL